MFGIPISPLFPIDRSKTLKKNKEKIKCNNYQKRQTNSIEKAHKLKSIVLHSIDKPISNHHPSRESRFSSINSSNAFAKLSLDCRLIAARCCYAKYKCT